MKLFFIFGNIPYDGKKFGQRVYIRLQWCAYALAGEAKCKSEDHVRKDLREHYDSILRECLLFEPCNAVHRHIDGNVYAEYNCTQRRNGHDTTHRNPEMLQVPTKSCFDAFRNIILFRNKKPCIWEEYLGMDNDVYQKGSNQLFHVSDSRWVNANEDGFCLLCLRSGQELIFLPEKSKHPLCTNCIWTRKAIAQKVNQVACPFCHSLSTFHPRKPDENGLRILSLDGGGAR
eukprot:5288445-Ditylum_brightwellii.AAC.1